MKLGELMQVLIEMGADLSWDIVIGFNNTTSGTVDSADACDGKLYLSCEGDASICDNDNPIEVKPAESGKGE